MTLTSIFIIAGIVLLLIFFLIAKLAIRWVLRVAIVGVILVAVIGAAAFWSWSNRLTTKPKPNRQSSAPTKRASSQ